MPWSFSIYREAFLRPLIIRVGLKLKVSVCFPSLLLFFSPSQEESGIFSAFPFMKCPKEMKIRSAPWSVFYSLSW